MASLSQFSLVRISQVFSARAEHSVLMTESQSRSAQRRNRAILSLSMSKSHPHDETRRLFDGSNANQLNRTLYHLQSLKAFRNNILFASVSSKQNGVVHDCGECVCATDAAGRFLLANVADNFRWRKSVNTPFAACVIDRSIGWLLRLKQHAIAWLLRPHMRY